MQYIDRIDALLEASMSREVMAEDYKKCRHCSKSNWAAWRCRDCLMGIPMCRGCIRSYHKENPFHRIEKWNGNFFRRADLWEVGTYLLIRHHTGITLCNSLVSQENFLEMVEKIKDKAEQDILNRTPDQGPAPSESHTSAFNWDTPTQSNDELNNDIEMENKSVADDGDDEEFIRYLQELRDHGVDGQDSYETENGQDFRELEDDAEQEEIDTPITNQYLDNVNADYDAGADIGSAQRVMGTYVRVVHTNGIHNIAMISCECQGHDILPSDLLAAGLLPTSFDRIRTLFSAQLLDHFRYCNLELKATAYQYYHLLQRLTSPMDPADVANLYREFRRMSRIWRWMKRLKWAGYGSQDTKAADVTAGELTVFCPACPQPGINIAENWKMDSARQVFLFNKKKSLLIYETVGYIGECSLPMETLRPIMSDKKTSMEMLGYPKAVE
jgi:hypothetical protein